MPTATRKMSHIYNAQQPLKQCENGVLGGALHTKANVVSISEKQITNEIF